MTITTELRKLHKTITGKDATGETIDEILEELNENYTGGGTVDTEMSDSSENAVQNKVIKGYVDSNKGVTSFECEISENGITSLATYGDIVEAFSTGTVVLHATQEDEDLSVDGYVPILLAMSVVFEQQENCILVVATQGEQSPALIRSIGAPNDTINITLQ